MMMETDESFQKKDREESDDDPHRDVADRIPALHDRACMDGLRKQIQDRQAEHDPSHE